MRDENKIGVLLLLAQTMGTLQDSLACWMFPAPRAFPTRTLAAAENPKGNCGKNIESPVGTRKKRSKLSFMKP